MDDVAFVREMIAFLSANYSIDSKNISGTGFSNGGGFTSRLAVDMSEDFDALATAAGSLGLPGRATRPISMVVSFGAVDDRINASAGVHPLPMDESLETLTQFTERFVLPYLFALDLADEYAFDEQNVAGKNVVRFTYSTSNSGGSNEFQLVVLEYLAHQYPNKTNYPMAMADFLWDFFQSYTLQ